MPESHSPSVVGEIDFMGMDENNGEVLLQSPVIIFSLLSLLP
jgi:hypothetical protein